MFSLWFETPPVFQGSEQIDTAQPFGLDRWANGRSQRGGSGRKFKRQGVTGSSWRDLRISRSAALRSQKIERVRIPGGRTSALVESDYDWSGSWDNSYVPCRAAVSRASAGASHRRAPSPSASADGPDNRAAGRARGSALDQEWHRHQRGNPGRIRWSAGPVGPRP